MTTIRSIGLRAVAAGFAVVAATACSDNLGVNASVNGATRILMQRDTSGTPAASPSADSAAGSPRSVRQDTIDYLKVTVVGIDYLAAGASDTSDGSPAWTHVNLASSFDLDLMSLPAGSSAQLIATGTVTAGAYSAVRLRVTNPRIKFKGDVNFGVAGILSGNTEYQVVIPSALQAGLKASAAVSVTAGGSSDVGLVFDCARSLGNIAVTGTGQVMMNAVLRAR